MSRHTFSQSPQSFDALTSEQVERIRTAPRSAAGELELAVDQLEEHIMPGLMSTN